MMVNPSKFPRLGQDRPLFRAEALKDGFCIVVSPVPEVARDSFVGQRFQDKPAFAFLILEL